MHLARPLTLNRRAAAAPPPPGAPHPPSPARRRWRARAQPARQRQPGRRSVRLRVRLRLQGRRDDLRRLPALRHRPGLVGRTAGAARRESRGDAPHRHHTDRRRGAAARRSPRWRPPARVSRRAPRTPCGRRRRPSAPPKPVSIAWGGDLTLGSSYGNPPNGGRALLAAGTSVLKRANIGAVNYEGTFGPGGASKCGGGSENCFAFQAPPGNARTLRRAGVDIVNHANNHAFDYGAVGWRSTRNALDKAKVAGDRSARRAEDHPAQRHQGRLPRLLHLQLDEPDGRRRGRPRRGSRAPRARPTSSSPSCTRAPRARTSSTSRAGRSQAFGEFRGDSRHFAHVAIDAGADLVLGSGPHVLRGLELYKNRLVAYSLGNLAGWHNFGTGGRSSLSALITVALGPAGPLLRGPDRVLQARRRRRPPRRPGTRRRQVDAFTEPRRLPEERSEDRPHRAGHRVRPRLAQQRQDALRGLVGLREHARAGLLQDVELRELGHLRGHVHVADAALGGGQVLLVGRQVVADGARGGSGRRRSWRATLETFLIASSIFDRPPRAPTVSRAAERC